MKETKLSSAELDEKLYDLEEQGQEIIRKMRKLKALRSKWELLACVPTLGRCFETDERYCAVIDLPRKEFDPDELFRGNGELNPYQLPCICIDKQDNSANGISEDTVYRGQFPGFERKNDETAKEITVERFIAVMQERFDNYARMIKNAVALREKLAKDEHYLEQDKELVSRLPAQAFDDPSDVPGEAAQEKE